MGTALFQMGEHTLAKIEHQAVLDLLESEVAYGRTQHQGRKGSNDVYIDTLVNMHRRDNIERTYIYQHSAQINAHTLYNFATWGPTRQSMVPYAQQPWYA